MSYEFDVLIVGAGFSGLYHLYNLRRKGFCAKIYETGSYLGGTWFWNRYPGARVDSDIPIYQFSDPEVWDFPWTERFPQHSEIRQYFRYLDNKWDLSKDIVYNTYVTSAQFNESRKQWKVWTNDERITWASHLLLCTGSTTTKYVPTFPGIHRFQGPCYHSYDWPKNEVDFEGKRVAVIGTGATGVQIIQELGPKVRQLTVYQRTPNTCLPMVNALVTEKEKQKWFPTKREYPEIFAQARKTNNGFVYSFVDRNTFDDSPSDRRKFYEELWAYGSFAFWLGNYQDLLKDKQANDQAYEFWAEKVRARIKDPVKKDLLAPLTSINPFGTKRPCLEMTYYEVCNLPQVEIINVRDSPITQFTERGIQTAKEGVREFDIIVLATGFDSLTGSITSIDIRNGQGESLRKQWKQNGCTTYLGLTTAGFPNLWYMYGPQGPTPFGNAPTIIEMQGEVIHSLLVWMREEGKRTAEAKKESQAKWGKEVRDAWESGLMHLGDSWYQGANVPGKLKEPLAYSGGNPKFRALVKEMRENHYNSFTFT